MNAFSSTNYVTFTIASPLAVVNAGGPTPPVYNAGAPTAPRRRGNPQSRRHPTT